MAWKPEYLVLLLFSTSIDYFAARKLEKSNDNRIRKILLAVSLTMNFSILGFFKYLNFFSASVNDIFRTFNIFYEVPEFQILLPVGISFYTLQAVSYTIDVYRRNLKAERNFFMFSLYITFFPQLVAGPIERAGNLLPQLKQKVTFKYENINAGLKIMFWGFFKKIVIADNFATYVRMIFDNPEYSKGLMVVVGLVFFSWQIYCDFSGYSDIAVGAARMLGITLMVNFRQPFLSQSYGEFWVNWHVSLSTWLRDYLFMPLSKTAFFRTRLSLALSLVFILSGLWHGASYTFVVWGALCALIVFVETKILKFIKFRNKKILKLKPVIFFRIILTFSAFTFCSAFFGAHKLSDAITLITNIFDTDYKIASVWFFGKPKFIYYLLLVVLLISVHLLEKNKSVNDFISEKPSYIRYPVYYIFIILFLTTGNFGLTEFYYFRF